MRRKQSICWDCRHSNCEQDDDFKCPWFHDGKRVDDWHLEGGFVVTCPRFVEDVKWTPGDTTGRWANFRPIKYAEQWSHGHRLVCLEERRMFRTYKEASMWLMSIGRSTTGTSGQLTKARANYKHSKRFLAYGYTWQEVPNDPRHFRVNYKKGWRDAFKDYQH